MASVAWREHGDAGQESWGRRAGGGGACLACLRSLRRRGPPEQKRGNTLLAAKYDHARFLQQCPFRPRLHGRPEVDVAHAAEDDESNDRSASVSESRCHDRLAEDAAARTVRERQYEIRRKETNDSACPFQPSVAK